MQDPAAYYQSMISKQQQSQFQEQQEEEQVVKCPRCNSQNTKFCYYNNYNLSQPRHFCKSCRRYWTKGGALRNVPVGGGSRTKNNPKRSVSTSSSNNNNKKIKNPDPVLKETDPDPDPTRMLYGFPIGDQDVKGASFSSFMGLGGIVIDGSGLDHTGLGMGLRSDLDRGDNSWTDLAMNTTEWRKTEIGEDEGYFGNFT